MITKLNKARDVASYSKDPSTKCGAVIYRPDGTIVSSGYNQFPEGMKQDTERLANRELKYKMIVHAEMVALIDARTSVKGCTIAVYPMPPCHRCASCLIQAGIKHVIAPWPSEDVLIRWRKSLALSASMLEEAGITLQLHRRPN